MRRNVSGSMSCPALTLSLVLAALCGCAGSLEPQPPPIDKYLPSTSPRTTSQSGKPPAKEEHAGPLTLTECVKIALAQNPMSEAARQGVISARETVAEAAAPYYPQVTFNAAYRRWKTHVFLPGGLAGGLVAIPTTVGPVNDYSLNVTGACVLFDAGERRSRLLAAKAQMNAASEQAAGIRQDIVLNVHQAYYTHTAALAGAAVARDNLARAEDHLRLAEKRRDIGVAVEADVLRSRVSTADARLALVEADNLVRVTSGNLNTAMGLPVETPVDVLKDPGPLEPPDKTDLNEALTRAVHARSELRGALQRIAAARSALDTARSAFGPRLTAQGQFGKRDDRFFPEDDDWSIGAAVEWPIFTGFSRVHALNRARSDLSLEEAWVRDQVLQVRQEVWTSHSELTSSYETVLAAQVLVNDASESMRLTKDRYEAGTNTITDLLDAQTALARARGALVRAQWSCSLSKARFDRATGVLTAPESR